MIVNIEAKVEKVEQYENKSVGFNHDYGKGSCKVSQTVNLEGTWEFESHPNLDAYAEWAFDSGSLDILLGKIGFKPEYEYNVNFSTVKVDIHGTKREWLKQAKKFHDGRFSDKPVVALEKMKSWENTNLNQSMIEDIKENLI